MIICYNERWYKYYNAVGKRRGVDFYLKGVTTMLKTHEVEHMTCIAKGPNHGAAPIPEEGKWVQAREIKDISGFTHGVGWCAPQQGACKLSLNIKDGIIQEALVETIGCTGMTHSAAMAGEILTGKTILEALNTDLVCDAINTAMRELFLQIVYGRSQSAFSEGGLAIGASLEDLGKGLRSQVGTIFSTLENNAAVRIRNNRIRGRAIPVSERFGQ
jgi:NifU-like protein involved in Fe-S cluster formation